MKFKTRPVADISSILVKDANTILESENIASLMKSLINNPITRHVYVIDKNKKMLGAVRLHVFVEIFQPYMEVLDEENFNKFIIEFAKKPVTTVMFKDYLFVSEDTSITEMFQKMLTNKVNELPILNDKGQITGEVNMLELLAFMSNFLKQG